MEFITYGPNSAAEGLAKAEKYNASFDVTNPAAYGSKPAPVMPVSTSGAATSNAIAAGNQVNAQLPGYSGDLAAVGKNISSDLAGTVPEDVMAELQQQAAEHGVSTGGATGAAYLKALGLTSLGLQETGQKDLQSILTSLPGAAISQNPNFQPTTAQTLDAGQQNSVWASAPDPSAAAAASLAAVRSGFGAGSGGGGGRLPAPAPSSVAPSSWAPPQVLSGSGEDMGNAPGSPGAYAAWNAWNGTPIYQGPGFVDYNDTGGNAPVDDMSALTA